MTMMPTKDELTRRLIGGALATARTAHAEARDQERSARLMRDVQPLDNCTSQHRLVAELGASSGGAPVAQQVTFGRIAFTAEPCMTCGSRRIGLPTDTVGAAFNPATDVAIPGAAQVLEYTTNSKGFFVGAKLLLFALGPVPSGYRVQIDVVFTGPAVRLGATV